MNLPMGSGLLLALAWFAAANVVMAAAAWPVARLVLGCGARDRAGLLLAVRLAPAAVSLVFVGVFFVPAHWRFEPADARETFGLVLYGLAALGAVLVVRSLVRMFAVARAGWTLRACRRLPEIDRGVAAYEMPGLAAVSLAGVFRTRVLVGGLAREALTREELQVALAHEVAHRRALDNVKRFLLYCAPDAFFLCSPAGRLEQQWRAAAESVADARAVGGDARRALDLASALVKVSRLASSGLAVTSPAWSTLHDVALLETRVRRLVEGRAPSAAGPRFGMPAMAGLSAAALLAGAATATWPSLHALTEGLVRLLP